MVRPTLKGRLCAVPGGGAAVAGGKRPGEAGKAEPARTVPADRSDEDLERRRRALESSLAVSRPPEAKPSESGRSGYAQAVKLSSEFIAGVAVGAVLGWVIDRYAGTSPFGLIVFLMLGFAAGVLNLLRSAGMVAQAGARRTDREGGADGA